ncbi:hypothetical protein B0O99DRAFT_485456, partial [Bisporella sp. PMI_857]
LHSFKSVREPLAAFSRCCCGHRSLLEDGKMLYRYISGEKKHHHNNFCYGRRPEGRLIDMDLEKELNSVP